MKKPTSICWNCEKTDCCWVQEFEPINGWIASKTKICTTKGETVESYCVKKCPKFQKDKKIKEKVGEIAKRLGITIRNYYRLKKKGAIK